MPGAPPNADALLGLAPAGEGRIGIFGDSGCLDSSHQRSACYGMLQAMLAYVAEVQTRPYQRNSQMTILRSTDTRRAFVVAVPNCHTIMFHLRTSFSSNT